MIDKIKSNIEREKQLINYITSIDNIEKAAEEKDFYSNIRGALINEIKILNSALYDLISAIAVKEEKIIEKKTSRIITNSGELTVRKEDRQDYLKFLRIEEEALKVLKKKILHKEKGKKAEKEEKIGFFTQAAGRLFSKKSIGLSKSDFFKPVSLNLKKSNMPYLLSTYISMGLLSTLISFIFGAILMTLLIGTEIISPLIGIPVALVIPVITFFVFIMYPSSEASSNRGKINDELPFAVMHMAAIAGSGVEPSKIFSILAKEVEYPAIKKEMRKIINQINFYGYDLVNSLRSTAKTTSNERFADILNGMATTISSGGELKEYLGKVASDTLLDYKLRRKRFTTISETYADIYTSLLIAAPLMFMLILVLMNVMGGGLAGLSAGALALIGIGVLIVMNIGFLVFLQFSQPES